MESSSVAAEPLLHEVALCDTDQYELVLLDSAGSQVLLRKEDGTSSLPTIRIPRFTRAAEKITSLLRTSWNISTVLLWSRRSEGEHGPEHYAVLETIGDPEQMVPELKWCPIDVAVASVLDRHASLIQNCQRKARKICFGVDPEPFGRLGWMFRLRDWINVVMRPNVIRLRAFQQFNGSESFSLVRFETDSTPVWFKAVGAPNLNEFPTTLLLCRLFPSYLPKILASDPLLNGWLMESGGEFTLSDCGEIEVWVKALRRLAELQVQSVGHTPELLRAGCHDLRLEALRSLVTPFFEVMVDLMAQQVKTSPPPLTIEEINQLARDVQESLSKIFDCCDLETLGHADFNPGNILIESERIVFIDWAEAYVGSPFLTFEYFLAHLRKSFPDIEGHEHRLRGAYITPWLSLFSEGKLHCALNLSPAVAPYVYAISSNAWRDPERLSDLRFQASLRSLARRMKREADTVRCKSASQFVAVGR